VKVCRGMSRRLHRSDTDRRAFQRRGREKKSDDLYKKSISRKKEKKGPVPGQGGKKSTYNKKTNAAEKNQCGKRGGGGGRDLFIHPLGTNGPGTSGGKPISAIHFKKTAWWWEEKERAYIKPYIIGEDS